MTFVKFCGITQERDLAVACELGVQAVGFVLWSGSPRFIEPDRIRSLVKSLPGDMLPVGVFVQPSVDELEAGIAAGIRVAQIHGVDPRLLRDDPVSIDRWIATSVEADLSMVPPGTTVLLDTQDSQRHGGTGRTIDWAKAAGIATDRRVLLAGGLTPANVATAIRQVRPFGVDVSSGIEERPGVKNAHAMRAFVAAVREADQ